jgi:hypothetical protein
MRYFAAAAVFAVFCSSVQVQPASADDTSPPKATATRPAQDQPGQTSLPSNAPPTSRTQTTTGSTDQSPVVKEMNAEEKKKLEIEGK